jgi:hypothetical protein
MSDNTYYVKQGTDRYRRFLLLFFPLFFYFLASLFVFLLCFFFIPLLEISGLPRYRFIFRSPITRNGEVISREARHRRHLLTSCRLLSWRHRNDPQLDAAKRGRTGCREARPDRMPRSAAGGLLRDGWRWRALVVTA